MHKTYIHKTYPGRYLVYMLYERYPLCIPIFCSFHKIQGSEGFYVISVSKPRPSLLSHTLFPVIPNHMDVLKVHSGKPRLLSIIKHFILPRTYSSLCFYLWVFLTIQIKLLDINHCFVSSPNIINYGNIMVIVELQVCHLLQDYDLLIVKVYVLVV